MYPTSADFATIAEHIAAASQQACKLRATTPLSGGDINAAYRLDSTSGAYFVKVNRPELLPMFVAEAQGLLEMAQSQTCRVPQPITHGATAKLAFIVLEYIEFTAGSTQDEARLGEQLAQLHHQARPYFGWHSDNTIGSTPQSNTRCTDWIEFWRTHRLDFQLKLAAEKGYHGKLQTLGAKLSADLDLLLIDYQPKPSLLHGDLWRGNVAYTHAGQPVLFDPACYYGDREADLAMTELFGGFGTRFYAAYNALYPLDSGYALRKQLYNLYHILNHLNLFGGSYLSQAERLCAQLSAAVR